MSQFPFRPDTIKSIEQSYDDNPYILRQKAVTCTAAGVTSGDTHPRLDDGTGRIWVSIDGGMPFPAYNGKAFDFTVGIPVEVGVHWRTRETHVLDVLIPDAARKGGDQYVAMSTMGPVPPPEAEFHIQQVADDLATHEADTAAHGATGAVVGTTNVQNLTNKTLTTPSIADFTNAQHDHLDADDGGILPFGALTGNSSGTVNTTDTTPTTIQTIATASNVSYAVEVTVVARRTGGTAGNAGDSAAYKLFGLFKNVAGTLSQVGATDKVALEDQAGWDADFVVSSTNILAQGTGAVDNSVTWNSYATVRSV